MGTLPALWAATRLLLLLLTAAATAPDPPLRRLGDDLTSIVFVGDLHGDEVCARQWISRTGLVNLSASPWSWTGGEGSAIVLMGDYVDKGSGSRAVLEFVRDLEAAFPRHVLAILGNHDLFALLDATLPPSAARPMGAPAYEFTFAFPHPQEYLEAGWSPRRPDDAELLAALLSGLQHVYEQDAEVRVMAPVTAARRAVHRAHGAADLFETAPPFRTNRSPSDALVSMDCGHGHDRSGGGVSVRGRRGSGGAGTAAAARLAAGVCRRPDRTPHPNPNPTHGRSYCG